MSGFNIQGLIDNQLRSGTSIHTPIVEAIVNGIHSIEELGTTNQSFVKVHVIRSNQGDLESEKNEIVGFKIVDNGAGFNSINKKSFDTAYSKKKISKGGKGLGRFTWLKYFKDVRVISIFYENEGWHKLSFAMGRDEEIIEKQEYQKLESGSCETTIEMLEVGKTKIPERGLNPLSRVILEKILPYFIIKDKICPSIYVCEADGSEPILLNSYIESEKHDGIKEIIIENNTFSLGEGEYTKTFDVRLFKIYSSRGRTSKISLVADRREVTETNVSDFIPEFEDEFYEPSDEVGVAGRNYILKAYVFSEYLDKNVSAERGKFNFDDKDLFNKISIREIEEQVASIISNVEKGEVESRRNRKLLKVKKYVEEKAVWHNGIVDNIDFSKLPVSASNVEIETFIQREKYINEIRATEELQKIIEVSDPMEISEKVSNLVAHITESCKNDLVHYVTTRKCVLDALEKLLEVDEDGKYQKEDVLHNIIYPKGKDSIGTNYSDHNLWILDERLNFTKYVASDKRIPDSGDPDIIAFHKSYMYRLANEDSNPITIFEFKKAGRDDFANASSHEDPVKQIIRYCKDIRSGNYKVKGRPVSVNDKTCFYGYVVCDVSPKYQKVLEEDHEFKITPDGKGWYRWYEPRNLFMEVITWDKLVRDARMRNEVFFNKIGISN